MQIYFRAGRLSSKLIPGQPWRALQLTKKIQKVKFPSTFIFGFFKKCIWTFSFFLFFIPFFKKCESISSLLFSNRKEKNAHEEQQTGAFQ